MHSREWLGFAGLKIRLLSHETGQGEGCCLSIFLPNQFGLAPCQLILTHREPQRILWGQEKELAIKCGWMNLAHKNIDIGKEMDLIENKIGSGKWISQWVIVYPRKRIVCNKIQREFCFSRGTLLEERRMVNAGKAKKCLYRATPFFKDKACSRGRCSCENMESRKKGGWVKMAEIASECDKQKNQLQKKPLNPQCSK